MACDSAGPRATTPTTRRSPRSSPRPTCTTASRGCRPRATCATASRSSVGIDPAADIVLTEIDGRAVAESGVRARHARRRGRLRAVGHHASRSSAGAGWAGRSCARTCDAPRSGRPRSRPGRRPSCVAGRRRTRSAIGRSSRATDSSRSAGSSACAGPTLADVPDAPLPDGLEIRPVTADQHRAIFDAEREAFRDHWSSREQTDEDFTFIFERPGARHGPVGRRVGRRRDRRRRPDLDLSRGERDARRRSAAGSSTSACAGRGGGADLAGPSPPKRCAASRRPA